MSTQCQSLVLVSFFIVSGVSGLCETRAMAAREQPVASPPTRSGASSASARTCSCTASLSTNWPAQALILMSLCSRPCRSTG